MSLMRSALLAASQSEFLRERAPRLAFVRKTVSRFMPGEALDDALAAAQALAASGQATVFTHLGENVTSADEARGVRHHYCTVLDRIRGARIPTEISVKLTHLGLDLSDDECSANLMVIVRHAAPALVWIDMEGSAYTARTIAIFNAIRREQPNIGVCVQAYLRRTAADVEQLIAGGAAVRLVKGAYREPPEIAYTHKRDIDENFFALASRLLSADARRRGVRAAIATHDPQLIRRIEQFAAAQGLPRRSVEFQMLYGIQTPEQQRLARNGYDSRVLIAYGKHWYAWFMRRLAERPANLWLAARNLI
jgi:proline dehydrogenase